MFASNVGVLPTIPDGCVLDARLVLAIPKKAFGRKLKRRRRRMRYALLHSCCPNVTNDVAPTIDGRSQGG